MNEKHWLVLLSTTFNFWRSRDKLARPFSPEAESSPSFRNSQKEHKPYSFS
jgi:hypothetical protein